MKEFCSPGPKEDLPHWVNRNLVRLLWSFQPPSAEREMSHNKEFKLHNIALLSQIYEIDTCAAVRTFWVISVGTGMPALLIRAPKSLGITILVDFQLDNQLVSSHLPTVPSSSTLMELNSAAPPSPSPCKSYCRFLFGSDSTAYAVDSCKRGCFSKLKTNNLMVTEYLLELFSCLFISRVFVRVILHSQLPTKEWASYPLDYWALEQVWFCFAYSYQDLYACLICPWLAVLSRPSNS